MNKAAAIKAIRQKLTEGEVEAALKMLIEQLEPQRKSLRDLSNRALEAKARLEKTQADELQGVISHENSQLSYQQINRQVIRLIDEWEDPSLRATVNTANAGRKFSPKMLLVALVLLAFVGIIIWQLAGSTPQSLVGAVHAEDNCPEFKSGTFSIMVMPFLHLRDPEATNSPHQSLAKRLDRFKDGFSGKFNTMVFSKERPKPQTDTEAINEAEKCRANLAIWGEYDQAGNTENSVIITTNYKYLANDNFEFTMLNLNEDSEVVPVSNSSSIPTRGFFVDTVQNYIEIINEATLSEELENQFRILFGVALMQGGDHPEDAIAILEQAETSDSSSILLKEMVLADGYVQRGDQQRAIAAYDRVLETHPNYWFAVNNRAMIYYEKGEYDKTLDALDQKLREEPQNVNALTIRGSVRLKTMQLKEAEEDLTKAQKLSETQEDVPAEKKQYIRRKIDLLEKTKVQEEKRVINANNILANDRTNLQALIELAEAKRNLGDYATAKEAAEGILRLDRDNLKAISIKLESANQTKNEREVTQIRKDIQQMSPESQRVILEERPILKKILNLRVQ